MYVKSTIQKNELKTQRCYIGCKQILYCYQWYIRSDHDLVTSSGERVLGTKSGLALNRGQITLIFLYREIFSLSLNRGGTKSGVTKSGSDCIITLGN
eukprot:sb/3479062/